MTQRYYFGIGLIFGDNAADLSIPTGGDIPNPPVLNHRSRRGFRARAGYGA